MNLPGTGRGENERIPLGSSVLFDVCFGADQNEWAKYLAAV
jgi:hypothetical protein